MALPPVMLDLPIPDAARRVTRAQLARWTVEARRLGAGTYPEALHDYRTSIRRLRSLLRVFHPWLPDLPGSTRRRLRRLMRLTSPARNLEVLIGWTDRHLPDLTPRQRTGVRWLVRRLEERLAHHKQTMTTRLADRDARLRERISRGLGRARTPVVPGSGTAPADLVVRRLIRRETGLLRDRLGGVGPIGGAMEIHAARIAAKRLRYLVEPFADELDYAAEAIEGLRTLQDLLGSVTDAHGLARELREAMLIANAGRAERLGHELLADLGNAGGALTTAAAPAGAQAGLTALARALRREGDEAFGRLIIWLEGPRQDLLDALQRTGEVNRGGRI